MSHQLATDDTSHRSKMEDVRSARGKAEASEVGRTVFLKENTFLLGLFQQYPAISRCESQAQRLNWVVVSNIFMLNFCWEMIDLTNYITFLTS